MSEKTEHFALRYAQRVIEMLHRSSPRGHYECQIYEVSGVVTALFITPTDQRDDKLEVFADVPSSTFSTWF